MWSRSSLSFLGVALLSVVTISSGSFGDDLAPRRDHGIFEDLNSRIVYSLPDHLDQGEVRLFMPGEASGDLDSDGIPDQLDVLLGALKAVLNGASYDTGYHRIPFPMGDVPREIGCCSDVVIRALRNAGIDLQTVVQRDIANRPRAYPHVPSPNPSIDHRRVRNLVVYMKKHFRRLDTDVSSASGWLPGDIVLFDTLPKAGPDHIGVISSTTGDGGLPLVINNWTWGSTTSEMELLSWCPVTHHFRVR